MRTDCAFCEGTGWLFIEGRTVTANVFQGKWTENGWADGVRCDEDRYKDLFVPQQVPINVVRRCKACNPARTLEDRVAEAT